MMEEKIKVSVIIPVYNVEDYIEKCLESVVNQTLKEIEIIVVNDGTKDNSIKKIEKYFSDSRIKIINKQNGGLSSARNAGLEIAKGEYISFIDSDDFIEEKMLEELYNESENADIVFSNNLNYNMLDNKLSKEEREFFFDKMSNKGSYICMYSSAVVWNKIYKRDFLEKNNLRFIEGIIHEDDIFTIKSHFLAEKVKYVKKFHYYYRINRKDSIMNNKVKNKHLENYKVIYEQVREFYDNFNGTNFEKLRLYLLKSYYLIFRMRLEGNVNKIEITNFENNFKKCYSELKLSRLEKRIIEDDVKRVLKNREYSYINLLDSFYWKNKFINKKIFRRIIEEKIRRIIKK
ncbi:glycosyltransferase [uncultured Fusobacterium sp.]|jgi:glycosyltransferase involved in cell wall biosynthesis|uniref:glycosyltransferase n=2 Tax=uncultured Fusobacterium sp. TaxID=159267 RepID=UPI0025DA4E02|nr:glycosyltransferase [uncultured Fusobacterium sp.]